MSTTRSRPRPNPRQRSKQNRRAVPPPRRDVPPAVPVAAAVALPLLAGLVGLLGAWTSVLFWIAVGLSVVLVILELRSREGEMDGDTVLLGVLFPLILAVPVLFDPRLLDAFAAPKLVLAAPGGIALAAIWLLRSRRGEPGWRNGVHWPALALLVWTALSGLVTGHLGFALIGADLSADGLLLLAGCVGLLFAVAGGLRVVDVARTVRVLVLGTGGIVVLYGAIQLHDRVWGGSWDWAPWASSTFSDISIWSTLGNPNHLSGLLAAIVPLGIVLVITERRPWVRVLAAVIVALAMVEIVQAAARGGWLATAAGIVILGLLIVSEIRGRVRVAAAAGALLLVALVGGVALGSHTVSLGEQLRSLVQFDDSSTTTERMHYWSASVEIGVNHPVVGKGPDSFRFAFPAVQDQGYVEVFGPEQVPNGPHNMILNQLATTGVPGLVALLALLVGVGLRGVGAWRRLHTAGAESRRERLILSGLLAALAALLVQSAFNVQQVAISFVLWLVLGLILVFARGTPSTWRPNVLLDPTPGEEKRTRNVRAPSWVMPTGAALAAVSLISLWPSSAPWRGEIAYADAVNAQAKGSELLDQPAEAERWFEIGTGRLQDAIDANPWRARYREIQSSSILDLAQSGSDGATIDAASLAQLAADGFRRATSLEPDNARLREGVGDAYMQQSTTTGGAQAAEEAVTHYEASLDRNPWVGRVRAKLANALVTLERPAEALTVLTEGLGYHPGFDVYRGLARTHDVLGDGEAEEWWRKALGASPGDPESQAAVAALDDPAP